MRNHFTNILLAFSGFFFALYIAGCSPHPEQTDSIHAAKIDSLVSKMTLQEKIHMLHGNSFFTSGGVKKLGIPEMHYDDGPFGVRPEVQANSWKPLDITTDSATYLPTGSALAATWNPKLAYKYGKVLGQEARARGKDVILGPAINIDRNPNSGRTFEFLTEDPYLDAQLAVAYIKGVQKQGVAACVKHFVANNQETNRKGVNEVIEKRALREIYMPAFKAAVQKAHVDAVMAAYNKVNGSYCAANEHLLKDVLRKQWGFEGMIVSDWGGVHSTVPTAEASLDVEMAGRSDYKDYYFATPLLDSVKAGKVSEHLINKKVKRILRTMFKLNILGNGTRKRGSINTPEHRKIAYKVASESIVLLKNSKKLLPFDASNLNSIAVIGDNATKKQAQLGFGAGVKSREVTPLAGLKQKLSGKVSIRYAKEYKEAYQNQASSGPKRIPVNKPDPELIQQAVKIAKSADAAIIIAGNTRTYETEGADRSSLALPFGENKLIKAVTAANPHTVVVIISGAPVELGQVKDETNALIWSGFNGAEGGRALADVLFGDVNPSGKLPFTFPKSLSDTPSEVNDSFPGTNGTTHYKEGILVGYRWYDTKNIQPIFPFGYGLSYTTFKYSDLKTSKKNYAENDTINVSVKVENTGSRSGKETVQLYVHAIHPSVMMAKKQLKAFSKVQIQTKQRKTVHLRVAVADLAYYDAKKNKWVVLPGKYQLKIGSSSRDIRGVTTINIQ
jgi:beta-glucosidase